MCGLFGYALEERLPRQEQLITQLALYNETRGTCSWGVYVSETDELVKRVGPIGVALNHIPMDKGGILIGHTRAATVGDATEPNAHPFEFEGEGGVVIGAHNGGIGNYDEMNKKYNLDLKVDSMHIFHHIANKLPLNELRGHGAITCLVDDTLLLSRFNGGILSVAHLKDDKGIIWSSEEGALLKAMRALGVQYTTYNIVPESIYYYENGRLLTSADKMTISSFVRQTHVHYPGYTAPDKSKSTRTKRPIIIKFHIKLQSEIEKDDEIEAIKAKIYKDDTLSEFRRYSSTCQTCRASSTTRYLKNKTNEGICLTCLAKGVQKGIYAPAGV